MVLDSDGDQRLVFQWAGSEGGSHDLRPAAHKPGHVELATRPRPGPDHHDTAPGGEPGQCPRQAVAAHKLEHDVEGPEPERIDRSGAGRA